MQLPFEALGAVQDYAAQFEGQSIERMAWSLSGCSNPYEKFFAMFDAYFDASGHESNCPHVVVSGYVANIIQWKAFERHWKYILDSFGIKGPFHMAEFMAYPRRGEFAKWQHGDAEADKLLRQLTTVQQLYTVLNVSSYVRMTDYNEVCQEYRIRDMLPPFALAARSCMALINSWSEAHAIQDPVECIFEDGDFGRGKFMDIMRIEGHPIVPKFEPKAKYGALQAADHAAWEQYHYLKKEMEGKHLPARDSFKMLLTVPNIHVWFPKEQLRDFCKVRGIEHV